MSISCVNIKHRRNFSGRITRESTDVKSPGYVKREEGKQDWQGARRNRTNLTTLFPHNINEQRGGTNKEIWEPVVRGTVTKLESSNLPFPLSLFL